MADPDRIIDISVRLNPSVPAWPGRPRFRLETEVATVEGAQIRNSTVTMDAHSGTHIDAPKHVIGSGKAVEDLALDALVGPAYVVRIPASHPVITAGVLDSLSIPETARRLILRTSNSDLWSSSDFESSFVGLDPTGAQWLVEREFGAVGIDYLSIQGFSQPAETHRILLERDVIIIEGLNMKEVEPGWYTLVCLPLLLEGAEGAPARAILFPHAGGTAT